MNPLTSISIIIMNIKEKDERRRFGAAVTVPGRATEIRSLSGWDEIIKETCEKGGRPAQEHADLDVALAEALDKHLGRGPAPGKAKDLPTRLLELALQGDTVLFSDPRGDAYAQVPCGDHREILPIDKSFEQWLSNAFYSKEKLVPASEAMRSVMNTLKGKAIYAGERHELHIRVAASEEAYWYYLGDERRRAIRIDRNGWVVIDEPPILFRHLAHMRPQDEPVRGRPGALDRLLDLMNLGEEDRRMFKIMLITDLVPGIAHCALSLSGPSGSGKTLMLKMEKQLIDPSELDIFPFVRDEQELIRLLDRHHIVPFDNLDRISKDRSDMLCQAVTGVALATRKKYTDDEDYIRKFKRIVRLNGISNEIRASDLLSRSILMELSAIDVAARRPESELWDDLYRLRPEALGELLDLFVRTIGVYEDFTPSPAPRMADWHEWAEAAALALNMTRDEFGQLFRRYEEKQDAEALEQSPLAPLIEDLADEGGFVGKASELLEVLVLRAEEAGVNTREREWPKNHIELGKRISPLIPNLASRGVIVERTTFEKLKKDRPKLITREVKGREYGPKDRMLIIIPEQGEEQNRNTLSHVAPVPTSQARG